MNTSPPKSFIQGESLTWQPNFANDPGAGYTLQYYFRSANGTFNASAGIAGKIILSSSVTAVIAIGQYSYQAWFEPLIDDGDSLGGNISIGISDAPPPRILAEHGTVEVLPGLSNLLVFDERSQAAKDLLAVRAALSGKASKDVQEYTIGNRSLRKIPISELLMLEKKLVQQVNNEKQNARLKKGGSMFKTILVRMTDD